MPRFSVFDCLQHDSAMHLQEKESAMQVVIIVYMIKLKPVVNKRIRHAPGSARVRSQARVQSVMITINTFMHT